MRCEEGLDSINSVVSGKISMKMFLNVGRSVFYYVPKLSFSRGKSKLLVGLVYAWFVWVFFRFSGIICATSLKKINNFFV